MSIQSATSRAASNFETVRAEVQRDRLLPWTSAAGFKIGPFVVNPMTLRSMVDLEIAGNAFLVGNDIVEGDIGAYIWRHHSDYEAGNNKDQDKFIAELSDCTDVTGIINQIQDHSSDAFSETLQTLSFSESVSSSSALPAVPVITSICHQYGAAYGIDPRDVADIDLRIVFQCCRAIRMAAGDVKFAAPKKLREAKSQLLKSYGTD